MICSLYFWMLTKSLQGLIGWFISRMKTDDRGLYLKLLYFKANVTQPIYSSSVQTTVTSLIYSLYLTTLSYLEILAQETNAEL